jgi:uncharacterized membrane protein/thiol-disulfide isomerase/thioredoxin
MSLVQPAQLGAVHAAAPAAQDPPPAVHALFFYSPTCPHCHDVINEHLLPMQERYGDRLVILGFDTSREFANNLFYSTLRHFRVPQDRWAVPLMVVGEEVLVGGFEIPSRFPSIVDQGLASGGIDFPDIPTLLEFLRDQGLLDPRYPDRRVAPQPSLPEDPPVADTTATPDTTTVPDTTWLPDTATVPDTAPPIPTDTPVAAVADTPAAPSPDTTSAPIPDVADRDLQDPAALVDSAALERMPEPPAVDTVPVLPGDTPGAVPGHRPPGTPGEGPVGLADAMRQLEAMTWRDRFLLDRAGNSLAVVVLLGMLVSLVLTGYPPRVKHKEWPGWVVPALVVVGSVVAAYLSFVEVTQTEAVCGPIGDCNTVQQSEYAFLFGVLPVGVLGLVGYGVILALWVLARLASGGARQRAALGLWAAALFGTLYSVYLTFLEPFVIGASCIWCLISAVIMTLLLWASAPTAARAWPGGAQPSAAG